MKIQRIWLCTLAGVAFSYLMSTAGCLPDDSSDADTPATVEELRGNSHRPRGGRSDGGTGGSAGADNGVAGSGGATGSGGTSGTGGSNGGETVAGCDVCIKANACCNAVGGGPLCTYSAGTCSSDSGSGQAAYVNACQTLLHTIISVHSTVPAECL